jgi:RNA polymerase sigma-70 factor (ECF subfamily)
MAGADDGLLIRRVQQGDRTAFNDLVYKYERRAYQYAFRLTANQDEASDIVAEAFVRAYNALKNFKGNSAFTTWLYRIITNCYLDHHKRERARQHDSLDERLDSGSGEVVREIEDPTMAPDALAERNERERVIQRALEKLPEYQRAMLVMFHAEALSYDQIAEALDLPLGTVKSRLNRARQTLRDTIGADMELF